MKKKIALVSVSTLAIIVLVIAFWVKFVTPYLQKAREAEAKLNLSAVYTGQNSFQSVFGRYSESFEEIGYRPEGAGRFQLYISPKTLPENVRDVLKEDQKPEVSEKHFRALAWPKEPTDGKSKFWLIDETKELKTFEVEAK